jgi:hypothetical protein
VGYITVITTHSSRPERPQISCGYNKLFAIGAYRSVCGRTINTSIYTVDSTPFPATTTQLISYKLLRYVPIASLHIYCTEIFDPRRRANDQLSWGGFVFQAKLTFALDLGLYALSNGLWKSIIFLADWALGWEVFDQFASNQWHLTPLGVMNNNHTRIQGPSPDCPIDMGL